MNARTVAPVQPKETRRCIGTLVSAFADDPVARWVFQEPDRYLEHFPELAGAFAEAALASGTAWQVDRFAGAAVWLAPGQGPDEDALDEVIGHGVPPHRHAEVFALFERMAEVHPQGPHWYLPLIGVEPGRQGRGYGSALLAEVTRVCDTEGLPAYLEATTLASVALYRRHGFRSLGRIQVEGSPPLFPMERKPAMH